jgi:sulfatase maturation enzyme AslB (radical SAM superfamily)
MSFDISNVKVLHLEPTSVCNAACPQCARYTNDGFSINPLIEIKDLALNTLVSKLDIDFIRQLDKMFMCGTYGEPAAHKQTLEIYSYFRNINPNITLGMNTNGSLRPHMFWSELGKILNRERDYCVFSIDGLADTNHIYRRNTNFNKIMENCRAFIDAGGRAHWDMLVFKHNEHQVDECMQLAKDMGFVAFRAKVSKRFTQRPITGLEPPEIYQPDLQYGSVSCHALNENSLYMNYLGEFKPCCWLGDEKYSVNDFNSIINNWTPTCVKTCSTVKDRSNFGKQWFREEYFV